VTPADWTSLAAGIRLVATDLDGTLLRADGSVSEFTVETLARARAAGVPVVFVTGRPPRWLPVVADATGHRGVAICANGAVVLDLATGDVAVTHPIDAGALGEVVATLRREVPGIAFAAEWVDADALAAPRDTEFAREPGFVPRLPSPGGPHGADILDVVAGRAVVKLLARTTGTGHDADSFLDHALGHVAHLVTVTHSNSEDVLLEMSAAGVSKGSTLAAYAEGLGLAAAHVAAAGDMPNDVPMLTWAGVGLAVEGAHPQVLAAADAALPGPAHDGVARFLDAVLRGDPRPV
jgi:hydroxymethylpyrimidine pyrophosphatase-like HAD family hydrolase